MPTPGEGPELALRAALLLLASSRYESGSAPAGAEPAALGTPQARAR